MWTNSGKRWQLLQGKCLATFSHMFRFKKLICIQIKCRTSTAAAKQSELEAAVRRMAKLQEQLEASRSSKVGRTKTCWKMKTLTFSNVIADYHLIVALLVLRLQARMIAQLAQKMAENAWDAKSPIETALPGCDAKKGKLALKVGGLQ